MGPCHFQSTRAAAPRTPRCRWKGATGFIGTFQKPSPVYTGYGTKRYLSRNIPTTTQPRHRIERCVSARLEIKQGPRIAAPVARLSNITGTTWTVARQLVDNYLRPIRCLECETTVDFSGSAWTGKRAFHIDHIRSCGVGNPRSARLVARGGDGGDVSDECRRSGAYPFFFNVEASRR